MNTRITQETQLPFFVEKGEDGYYVVECPVLEGCYTQGKTLDEALKNIREVIDLIWKKRTSANWYVNTARAS